MYVSVIGGMNSEGITFTKNEVEENKIKIKHLSYMCCIFSNIFNCNYYNLL